METLWQLILVWLQNKNLLFIVLIFFTVLITLTTIYDLRPKKIKPLTKEPYVSEDLRLSDWTEKQPLIIHDEFWQSMWLLTFIFIIWLVSAITFLFDQISIYFKIINLALPGIPLLIIYSHRYLLKKRRLLIHSGAISSLEFGTIPWNKIQGVLLTNEYYPKIGLIYSLHLRVHLDEMHIHSFHWSKRLFLKLGITELKKGILNIKLREPDKSMHSIFDLIVHYYSQAKQAQSQAFVPPSD